ncbi:aspartyl-phosphate phosphatase Spo0E family protein [Aneurinibacillus sp. BA2021]|nr:aspartyl-phosphate phosphatase Spo0E family protein [Aneurinibacillus sp. BA2021]
MKNQLHYINQTIEHLRYKMNELAKEKALTDPEVLSVSRLLDRVLLEYYEEKRRHAMKYNL